MTTLSRASRLAAHVPIHVYVAMLVGVAAGSLSPILSRFVDAEGTPPLTAAAVRMGVSALVMLPILLFPTTRANATTTNAKVPLRELTRRDWLMMGAAGALLAFYFTAWFEGLQYVNVFVGMVMVTSTPIWIAIIEAVLFRIRPNRLILLGMALAFAGNLVIALAAWSGAEDVAQMGSNPLLGAGLSLVAALAASVYRVLSRSQLRKVSLVPFQTIVYSGSTAVLLIACLLTGTALTGYSGAAYVWMILLALLPQLVGYTASNYALRFLSATYVTLVIQIEVVLSALFALVLFSEMPTSGQIIGGVVIMAGVALASVGRS